MIAGFLLAAATPTRTMAQTKLKVIVFPTLANLAQYAAQAQGYYSKRGLEVELVATPNSDETRQGLAQGRYQIAHGGVPTTRSPRSVENDEDQRPVHFPGRQRNADSTAPDRPAGGRQLRGPAARKTLAVDSPVTAFADP